MEHVLRPIDRGHGLIDRVFLNVTIVVLVAMLAGNAAATAIEGLDALALQVGPISQNIKIKRFVRSVLLVV